MKRLIFCVFCIGFIFLTHGCNTTIYTEDSTDFSSSTPIYTDSESLAKAKDSRNLLFLLDEEYKIGPGDVLEISIFEWELRGETKTASYVVSETGRITLPVIESIHIDGDSVASVKSKIENSLKDGGFIRHPRVSVDIAEYRSKRVSVIGNVRDPGMYTLRNNVTTLLDILSLAGGVTEDAGQILTIIRPKGNSFIPKESGDVPEIINEAMQEKIVIDLFQLLEVGNYELNMVIGHGTHIYVPPAKYISVIGHVKSPGKFHLQEPTTILDAIAMANGIKEDSASLQYCALKRKTEEGESLIHLDIEAIKTGEKANFYVLPHDIIDIRQTPIKKIASQFLQSIERVLSVGFRLDD